MTGTQAAARRKRRSPEEIRDLLLDAAAEEFEQSGFSGATTAAIARRADVTEAQIFRYFPSKAELFRAAIFAPLNRHFADFQARSSATPDPGQHRDQARAYITELQGFMARHSRMLMSLVVAQAYDGAVMEGIGALGGYFDRGAAMMKARIGEGAGQPRVDPELMVRVSFAAVLGCALFGDWMFPPGMASPDKIRDAIIDFVIDGLNANGDLAGRTDVQGDRANDR